MFGSAIPKAMDKHPGLQPLPEITHYDCAEVNCMQKKAWRLLDGDLESFRNLLTYGAPAFFVSDRGCRSY